MRIAFWLALAFSAAAFAGEPPSLSERAEQGDTAAAIELGKQLTGGAHPDQVAARDWFRRAADAGSAEGAAWLGVLYRKLARSGEAFDDDPAGPDTDAYLGQAEHWLRVSAEAGDPIGQMWLADLLALRADEARQAEALRWFEASGNQGVKRAMREAAAIHAEGRGGRRDPAAALAWYRRLADGGDVAAMFRVAFAFEYGLGVARDPNEARNWRKRAGPEPTGLPKLLEEIAALSLATTKPSGSPPSAVLRRIDGTLRTVHIDDRVGTHQGVVVEIGSDSITLVEVIEESGGYFERRLRMTMGPDRAIPK